MARQWSAWRLWLGYGSIGLVVVVLAAVGLWYLFVRVAAPPSVSLTAAVNATPPAAAVNATPPAAAGLIDATKDGLDGSWQVVMGGDSFVGYRVKEELAQFGIQTVVGRTTAITGSLDLDGTTISAVTVEADVTQLKSDDFRRDRSLGRQGLETGKFPTATFVLNEPIVLDAVPKEGVPIIVDIIGALTLHGVTRNVGIELEGQLANGRVVVVGSTVIEFADYDMETPSARIVLSIEDHGVMEFQLIFERS